MLIRTCSGRCAAAVLAVVVLLAASAAPSLAAPRTFRLYEGITLYVQNETGEGFDLDLDVRDINLMAGGPRTILLKVYDPEGHVVVREVIPDDGVASANFPGRIGGWDHELQYYADLYAKGAVPSFRWSAWSEPARLASIVARRVSHAVPAGKPGRYRIVLAGAIDHYVTVSLSPGLPYGVTGHTTFLHGHGDDLRRSYIYVPPGTAGIFFAVIEPDLPRTRRFTLTAPDGKVLFDGPAEGGYGTAVDEKGRDASIRFASPGQYDGELLTFEVSPGPGDFLVKLGLQQAAQGPFKGRGGMASSALFASDREVAMALQGGTQFVDGELFWHPLQQRFHAWLRANPATENASEEAVALRQQIKAIYSDFRLLETSDGAGSATWTNWAYGMGYYAFKVFQPCWALMQRDDVPADLKAILREGLIMAGDRLSFAAGMERVNGNAFAQIPVALWYCHQATGDAMQKERFELFFDRWQHEGWGPGAGLSPSGDAQEHFAHDMHYGSYLLDNWAAGGTWVRPGILEDATDEPRFAQVIERYRELYSYLYCREADGRTVAANPWSSRTHMSAHKGAANWETAERPWKGEPGPDFTVSVNGGDEWFAARRPGYYMLTFHGRLAPQWMSECFPGQLGFGGGILCQLTVPGRGPVLASTLAGSYGEGMHPSNWRNFHIHSLVGERWDGQPLITGISEHDDAALEGIVLTSSGEVRDGHVRVARRYDFEDDAIACEVSLAESDYGRVLSIWSGGRRWSEVREAWEMIPYIGRTPDGKPTAVTLLDAAGQASGPATSDPQAASGIRIDRGGFGVVITLDHARPVKLGARETVLIDAMPDGARPVAASAVAMKYRIVPFGE